MILHQIRSAQTGNESVRIDQPPLHVRQFFRAGVSRFVGLDELGTPHWVWLGVDWSKDDLVSWPARWVGEEIVQ